MLHQQFKDVLSKQSEQNVYKTEDPDEILVIDKKYNVIRQVGSGATSVVVKAQSQGSKKFVAIKKIKRVFEHTAFAQRAMRELKILRCLGSHENIIQVHDLIMPQDKKHFNELYVVTDYMKSDLHDVIRVNSSFTRDHKQYFMYQLLKGLKYIHSAGVIHRDIKPQNLLVNEDFDLRICDFGLATVKIGKINKDYDLTNYVVTRWYRAPELLLKYNQDSYTSKIDMWSVGCVFAEMYMKRVLFGEPELDRQINRFVALLGIPSKDLMSKITDANVLEFLQECEKIVSRVDFDQIMPGIEPDALDLMKKLLEYDPAKRISAEDALRHPYFSSLHDEKDEPSSKPIDYFDFEFEQYTLKKSILRQLILDEIVIYKSKEARKYYQEIKKRYPNGVLETIYMREDNNTAHNNVKQSCDYEGKQMDEFAMVIDEGSTDSSLNSTPESKMRAYN